MRLLGGLGAVAGVVAFPTSNCRSTTELDEWLDEITHTVKVADDEVAAGPIAAKLIVRRSNRRPDEDASW